MATSLEESGNKVRIVNTDPVGPEIIWLKLKKEEITECKIYSPVGKFAERAK